VEAGTAAKYSNGDRSRCRTRVRTGLLLHRQRPRIPGRGRRFEPLSRKNALPSVLSHLPAVNVQGARSAVSRLTVAADAGGQCGLVQSAAGIAPVLIGEMGVGAELPCAPKPELTARAAAPVRATASSSPVRDLFCAVAWSARRGRSAKRADRRTSCALIQSGQVPGCHGRQAADGTAGYGGISPPERTGVAAGLLADGLMPGLAAGTGHATPADYLK
jgi:hypothetical protein